MKAATKTTRTFFIFGSKGQIIGAFKVKITNKAKAAAKKVTKIETIKLRRTGTEVLAKTTKAYGCYPLTYANKTQAEKSAYKLQLAGLNADVYHPGGGVCFYVRIN